MTPRIYRMVCVHPRHDEPCPQPCSGCEADCGADYVIPVGAVLPDGWTVPTVDKERARWSHSADLWPVASVQGVVVAWAIPLDPQSATPDRGACAQE